MKNTHQNIYQDQAGFASVVVALILIIVLALVTVGFAKLARHEQESALDKQLGTQAYYAAESGINDAVDDIRNHRITENDTGQATAADANSCMNPIASAKTSNPDVNPGNGVSYSCLLIDLKPKSLEWTPVSTNSDQTLSFVAPSLSTLNLKWKSLDPDHQSNPRGSGDRTLARKGDWNSPAVIQFTIVPLGAAVSLNQESFTTYMYPAKSPNNNTVSYTSSQSNQGSITPGNCTSSDCNVTINNIPAASKYLIHFFDYYDDSKVTLSGTTASGDAVGFAQGQAKIDVTGKARNVLKRLQVRVPIFQTAEAEAGTQKLPNYALEGQNICKRIVTLEGATYFDPPKNVLSSSWPATMSNWFDAYYRQNPCLLDQP